MDGDSFSVTPRDSAVNLWCNRFTDNQYRRTTMTLSSHVQTLKQKHESLSEAVEVAQRSPATDDLEIARMKKKKLHLKEEISRLSAE
jgi:hypothetical protein